MSVLASLEAERTCLGAVLVDKAALVEIANVVRVEHFTGPNRTIYAAMLAMSESGRSIDLLTLRDELGSDLEGVGGAEYLAALFDGLPRVSNPGEWARIVREKARRRAAVHLARQLLTQAERSDVDTLEMLHEHQARMARLVDSEDHGIRRLSDVVGEAYKSLEAFASAPDGMTGLPTGLPTIDKLTGGLHAGALWVFAARPSRGKSSLCTQIAVHVAGSGRKVLVFSMEMPPPSVVRRMLLSEAEVDRWDLRRPSREQMAWDKVASAYGRISGLPVWFDGRPSPTLAQIVAAARQHRMRHGLDLVVVDYIQRCTLEKSSRDQWVGVGDVVKGLKNLALGEDIPVLAACQLTADAEESRPTLADLAQARQVISAEADVIAFLHPKEPKTWRQQDAPLVDFLLDKQRDGATMPVALRFERRWTRFLEEDPFASVAMGVA